MKAKFKRFFSSMGLTKAQLITVVLCYFLCFAIFLGIVVFWDPMSKPTNEQTMVVEAATGPTNTSGSWITEGRYSIDWYTNPGSNDGSSASKPYIIDSAEDLAGLSWLVYTKGQADNPLVSGTDYSGNYIFRGKYFKQTINIDLSAYYWQPIGIRYTREGTTRQNYFSGSYDGGNHTVSGIYTPAGTTNAYSYQGLFGYVYSSSSSYRVTIQNVGITNSFIQGNQYIGGVVGYASSSTVTNSYNTGAVSGSGNYVSGVVGYASGSTTITNCYNTGEVNGYSSVGGVVGSSNDTSYASTITISNCYNIGVVIGSGSNVGGVVGYATETIIITDSLNAGEVSGTAEVGGVVGDSYNIERITIINCHNIGNIKGTGYVGGVIGRYAFTKDSVLANCYNTGSVSGSNNYVGGVVGYTTLASSASGIIKAIRNCYNTGAITSSRAYVGGIVGYVSSSNITITNCYNTGSVTSSGNYVVGGIVGRISVAITNCYYGGGVTETLGSYGTYLSNIEDSAKTLSWYTTASNWDSEYPWDFDYTWVLDASENDGYPNLTGYWTHEDRFSIDWYTNPGSNDGSSASKPYIIDSPEDLAGLSWLVYTKGQTGSPLKSSDYSGNYIFQDKYFKQTVDIDLSEYYWQPIGINYTREGTTRRNYFSGSYDGGNYTVSGIFTPAGATNAYSYQALFGIVYPSSSSYRVTIQNLGITNSFIQGNQYVGGIVSYTNYNLNIINCYNTGSVTSTATSNSYTGGVVGYAYSNTTITNCYNTGSVSGSGNNVGGVVGYVGLNTIITNCYNTGTVISNSMIFSHLGGVVGYSAGTTITNCYNAGSVSGYGDGVGGVVGNSAGTTITNCYNTGVVTISETSGSVYVGGVVAYASSSTITNSYNTGSVSGFSYVGGVVGYASNSTTITNCYNTGDVTGSRYVGGVVGDAVSNTTITNCYNMSSVTGSSNYVGGVVGVAEESTITNCYNTGGVSGSSSVGGVVGGAYNTSITNCYNTGNVTSTATSNSDVGGVVGYASVSSTTGCNISKSANFGDITVTEASGGAGGIIGNITISSSSYPFKLTHCYSEGSITVSGTGATVGGFVGNLNADYSTYSNVKIEFCSVDLDIVVSGGSIASQGAFYGGTNGIKVENSYSLLTKSGTVSKVISDVSTQMDNNFGYMLNFREGKPIPLGIFHILDVATRTGIVNRINAL